MVINTHRYIQKIVKEFHQAGAEPQPNPCFDEAALYPQVESEEVDWPYREAIGCLQWCATVARPDISQPLSVLARFSDKKPTHSRVKAIKKVIRYLKGTSKIGPNYSPKNESDFKQTYGELIRDSGKKFNNNNSTFPNFHLFSGASFASVPITLNSASGSILYYRSMPVLWKGVKQALRTHSTAESEYAACSDSLVLQQSVGFGGFFEDSSRDSEECPVWVDNQSAIMSAENEVVRPKSRHYVLRNLRVKDSAERLVFCPTNLEKADPLTKVNCSKEQRDLLFWHTYNVPKKASKMDVEEGADEIGEELSAYFAGAMIIL
jgi:hypothetical protein